MPPLRALLVTAATGWRGSSASFAKIATGILAAGHGVHLVAGGAPVAERFRELGLPVTLLPLHDTGLREVRALRAVLRTTASNAILVDTPRDLRVSLYAARLRRPVIYRYNLGYRRPRTDLSDGLYLRAAAGIVYQSAFIQDQAERHHPLLARRRHWRIPNGYDLEGPLRPRPEAGAALRMRLRIPADVAIVLTGSVLGRQKGHGIVLEALAQLTAAGHRLAYVVSGAGTEEAAIRARADALGVPTHFLGFVEPARLPEVMAGADVVAHPATDEIFPNVVAEAMALERAVVGADAGGTPEVIGRDGCGALVASAEVEAWADAIGALLGDPAGRVAMGRAARSRIAREFPIAAMQRRYAELLAAVAR